MCDEVYSEIWLFSAAYYTGNWRQEQYNTCL